MQFGGRSSDKNGNGVVFPTLKVDHPFSRLAHPDELTLRGASRVGSLRNERQNIANKRSMDLPYIPENVAVNVSKDRSKVPMFGNNTSMSDRIDNRSSTAATAFTQDNGWSRRLSAAELEHMLRNKMKTGYFSAKNLFLSYDTDGLGTIKREFVHRVVCTLLAMKISFDQFNRLMKRVGLDGVKMMSFATFYAKFKKPNKEEISEYPTWFSKNETSRDLYTTNQVHTKLKIKAAQNFDNLLRILGMDDGDTIIKPVFQNQLQKIGYAMSAVEFEKLWKKYDTYKTGVIDTNKLYDKLIGNCNTASVAPRQSQMSGVSNSQCDRELSINIEKWLGNKFREGFHDMRHAFKEFAVGDAVTRDEFLLVLKDYGLVLTDDNLELLLQRCNVPAGNLINFKLFMKMFQARTMNAKANQITGDVPIRYYEQGVKTKLSSGEEHLMDMFQGDYIRLKHKFQNSNTISDTSSSVEDQEIADVTRCVTKISEKSRHGTNCERSAGELTMLIKALLRQRFQEVQKIFYEIDEKNTKRMTKYMMQRLLRRIGLSISKYEIEKLWNSFITDLSGTTVAYTYFIRHFGYSPKSAAYPNSKIRPPVRGDADFRMRSNRFNSWRELLQDHTKISMETNYETLLRTFLKVDRDRMGHVTVNDFKVVLRNVCFGMTEKEVQLLTDDISKDDRILWEEFMKTLRSYKTGNNMADILKHSQEMSVGQWKDVRRLFKQIDRRNQGTLSVDEFRNILKLCNIVLDQNITLSEVDRSVDGKVEFRQLQKMFLNQ